LDRARDRHRRRAGDTGHDALADRACERVGCSHETITSSTRGIAWAPSRSVRWSPTRSAFAIAVSAGLTAADDGKKLVSTTYRLSRSWAFQSTSRTDVLGSFPKRAVPQLWAMPAIGICWSKIGRASCREGGEEWGGGERGENKR